MRLVSSLRWPTSGAHEITLGKTLIFVLLGYTKVNWSLDGIANAVNGIVASPLRTRAPPRGAPDRRNVCVLACEPSIGSNVSKVLRAVMRRRRSICPCRPHKFWTLAGTVAAAIKFSSRASTSISPFARLGEGESGQS
jgi:hypothetical protein